MLKNIIDTALKNGAQSGDAFMLESSQTAVSFENNLLKSSDRAQMRGIGARVVRNDCLGFASSSDLTNPNKIARLALDVAKSGEHTEIQFPNHDDFEQPKDIVDESVRQTSIDELIETGWKFINRVKEYDPEILASASLETAESSVSIANSEGLEASYNKTIFYAGFYAQIIDGTTVIYCHRDYAGTTKSLDLDTVMQRVIDDCRTVKKSASLSSGKYPIILTPRAMAALSEFLRAGVNGRNVQKGISPIRNKLGEEILDDRITFFENSLMPGGLGSAPFDDEGIASQKKPIVEGGVLRSFITDLATSAKLHDLPTGNGIRYNPYTGAQDYESIPMPMPTNWILEHGDVPLAGLMADISKGILVDDMVGLFTSNFLAGDFSGNLHLGYLIRNGEIVGRLKDTMITGNLYELLKNSLIDLSRESETLASEGGTGVFPYVALKDVNITS